MCSLSTRLATVWVKIKRIKLQGGLTSKGEKTREKLINSYYGVALRSFFSFFILDTIRRVEMERKKKRALTIHGKCETISFVVSSVWACTTWCINAHTTTTVECATFKFDENSSIFEVCMHHPIKGAKSFFEELCVFLVIQRHSSKFKMRNQRHHQLRCIREDKLSKHDILWKLSKRFHFGDREWVSEREEKIANEGRRCWIRREHQRGELNMDNTGLVCKVDWKSK